MSGHFFVFIHHGRQGGAVLAIGVYALQFCLLVFGPEAPLQLKANGVLNEEVFFCSCVI